jgi:uncharacterized cupin superfamily protein
MRRVNIGSPEFKYDPTDPPGFRSGMLRFGPQLDASQLGASVYELPPGQAICPYHYELVEEEWLLVLEGRPSVRHPEGTDRLEPWDAVCFPTGKEGAHAVRNETDETVRVLMFSRVEHPAVTIYPDSDKVGVYTGDEDDDVIVPRSSDVDYWHGETG